MNEGFALGAAANDNYSIDQMTTIDEIAPSIRRIISGMVHQIPEHTVKTMPIPARRWADIEPEVCEVEVALEHIDQLLRAGLKRIQDISELIAFVEGIVTSHIEEAIGVINRAPTTILSDDAKDAACSKLRTLRANTILKIRDIASRK